MPQQAYVDDLVMTLVGAVVFSVVIAGAALGYHPSQTVMPPTSTPANATLLIGHALAGYMPTVTLHPPSPTMRPPTSTPSPVPSSASTPRPIRQPSATPTKLPTPKPTQAVLRPEDHYWFERPIAAGGTSYISHFYAYGSTYRGRYQVHHGVEFENPTGTPVLAAGPGRVVVAGPDNPQVYGLFADFYGQLVVIEHDRTWRDQPVFTLYGHLSTVEVEVGQQVEAGQVIGKVGATGIALGPHLHMEIRVGQNTYDATRNPELWIKPFDGHGTIAGRLVDAAGNYIPGALISLYDDQNAWRRETETYGAGVNPDEGWRENFVFGDLPAGSYTVQFVTNDSVYAETFSVEAGKTVLVTLQASG